MNWSLWIRVAAVLLIAHGAYGWWTDRPASPAAGVLAPGEPRQQEITAGTPVDHGRWRLTPRARYEITARVLGRERYAFDTLEPLVPVDLALGWGPMSDGRVLAALRIDQSARYYTVHWGPEPPLPPAEILRHSANLHAIPATTSLGRSLDGLRVGQVVRLSGELVDAVRDDGAWIRTSLTREDTGPGACEVMLVESLAVASTRG
jgi:hypothetical protein